MPLAWQKVLQELKARLPEGVVESWFSKLQVSRSDGALVIKAPNRFFLRALLGRWGRELEEALKAAYGQVEVRWEVASEQEGDSVGLNPRLNFENYIVLRFNSFPAAALKAFVRSEGASVATLVGPPGTGKTHLLQAVGNEASSRGLKVKFARCEAFFAKLMASLKREETAGFRLFWRDADLLIIDDLDYAQGKPFLQEELLHTLDALSLKGSKVLLASRSHPKDLGFSDALKGRLLGGLVLPLAEPSAHERAEFLRRRLRMLGVPVVPGLPEEVAELIPGGLRELEGAAHRLQAYYKLVGGPVSLENARSVLADLLSEGATAERALKLVCDFFGVSKAELLSGKRKRRVSLARHALAFLLTEGLGMGLSEAAEFLGVGPSAVLYGVRRVSENLSLRRSVEGLLRKLKA